MELAEYISSLRLREAEEDLAEFERTHRLRKVKEALKRRVTKTLGPSLRTMRSRWRTEVTSDDIARKEGSDAPGSM